MRQSFRECMSEALRPVMHKHLGQPAQSVRLRLSTRGNFGDAQLRPQRAFGKMFLRMIVVFPVGAVATVLCFSVVGLPLGMILFAWIGSWCTKPLMKHPAFSTDVGIDTRGSSSPTVEKYEQAYDEYEGREWK